MPRMYCSFYVLLLLGFIASRTANAQQATSRWTLGAEIGISVVHEAPFEISTAHSQSWNSTQLANLTVDYRLFRWLVVRAEGNLLLNNLRRAGRIIDNEFTEAYLLQWSTTTPFIGLTAGPQFLFRIGQGDLALDLLAGAGYRYSRAKGTGSDGQVYDFRFEGAMNAYLKLGLSYTYWPTDRFGITLGGETATLPYTTGRTRQIKNPDTVTAQYPDIPLQVLQRMSNRTEGNMYVHLTLGVAYRL